MGGQEEQSGLREERGLLQIHQDAHGVEPSSRRSYSSNLHTSQTAGAKLTYKICRIQYIIRHYVEVHKCLKKDAFSQTAI